MALIECLADLEVFVAEKSTGANYGGSEPVSIKSVTRASK